MALQLAPTPEQQQQQQQQQQQRRPQSAYYGNSGDPYGSQAVATTRNRSQSQAGQRQYTKEGRPILHYCKYLLVPC